MSAAPRIVGDDGPAWPGTYVPPEMHDRVALLTCFEVARRKADRIRELLVIECDWIKDLHDEYALAIGLKAQGRIAELRARHATAVARATTLMESYRDVLKIAEDYGKEYARARGLREVDTETVYAEPAEV